MTTFVFVLPMLLLLGLTTVQDRRSKRYLGMYSFGLLGLTAYVVWSFVTENYALTWVAKHSDATLPITLKIAAVWAGQEGTLLLWLLALLAITWVYPWGRVTKVLLGEQFLLMIGFLLLNPLAKSGIDSGIGLNPLLRTSWMLFHPPVVFIGYALLTVPFAESLLGEERQSKRYLRLGWLFLGVGLALGGFWAYRVLGWGGFWAWDPVEAASLVPWLLTTMALHLYQREHGYPFTLMAYTSVLWAITITRSGVLATSSVHAFVGSNTALYLYAFFTIHAIAVGWVWFRRRQKRDPLPLVWQAVSLYALWVVAGTALPLVTRLFMSDTLNVGPGFYRSGAIPALLLTIWALRHSLKRDGTAQSLAHFGVVLFLVGVVASASFTSTRTVALESGELEELGDLSLTYFRMATGGEIAAVYRDDSMRTAVELRQADLVKPVIWRQLWQDVYIAPISIGDRGGESIALKEGEVVVWNGIEIRLLGLLSGMRLEGHTLIAELLCGGELVTPALVVNEGSIKGRKAALPTGGAVALVGVEPDSSQVTLQLYSPEEAESLLVAEVSVKPLMNFVRIGVVLTLFGGFLASVEKKRELE